MPTYATQRVQWRQAEEQSLLRAPKSRRTQPRPRKVVDQRRVRGNGGRRRRGAAAEFAGI